jgi:ElaB/YqjD/DUF883 family membrane-anchored ribosome-binding protein
MDHKTEVIHHNIEETRSALANKVEALEEQVVDTVQGTTSAVAETVDTVKEAVQETVEQVKETVQGTVEAVKETFDIGFQCQRRPWLMFGGSVGLGFLAGKLLGGGGECAQPAKESGAVNHLGQRLPSTQRVNGAGERPAAYSSVAESAPPSGKTTGLMGIFGDELAKLKKLAIGTVLGLAHDLIERNLHGDLGQHLNGIVDDLNEKLGGEKLRGVFSHNGAHQGDGREGVGRNTTSLRRPNFSSAARRS